MKEVDPVQGDLAPDSKPPLVTRFVPAQDASSKDETWKAPMSGRQADGVAALV
ncbi:hypothetical protein GTY65_11135 [Streptomyces sp. SID8379]|nr:hypothetical protein [Streptomyces sp. SID8379]MYW64616.1 hypothetical protein [Streptomyces sp. SID8379]